jgi:RNA polymerase sigma factor (sigma-70 family)
MRSESENERTPAGCAGGLQRPARAASTRARAAEDWLSVLQRLVQGDPLAHLRVTSVIMGLLVRARAFDVDTLWEDICQDVLASLVQSVQRDALRDPGAFVGYCAAITRNELTRRREQQRRSRVRESAEAADDLAQPMRRDRDVDLLIDMERALEELPEKIRSVVHAIYLEGRSYEDAAASLGVPLGTLKRLQTQGLRLLRDRMEACG